MKYVLLSLMLSGCVAHSPVAQSNCCQRLDIRTVEMQRYYRFCKTLAKGVVNRDPKALRNRHVPGLLAACRNSRKSSREKHANRARKALDAVRAAPANRKKRFFRDIFAKCESLIFSRLPISGTKPTVTLIVVYLARVAWEL